MVKLISEIIRECRKTNDKILSVHSRKSATDVLDIIDKFKGKVILHWFTGNLKELDQAPYNGYYFSINHQMVSSKSGMSIIKKNTN